MAGDGNEDDVDRAAILARRQKFIALALSGLAASCGDDGTTGEPQPCLDVGPVTTGNIEPGDTDGATSTTGGNDTGDSTGGSASDSGSGSDSGSDSGDDTAGSTSANDGETGTTGRPMPCLAPKGH